MKPHSKFRWLAVLGVLLILGMAAHLLYDRFAPIDFSKEEEPFCSMAMPAQSAWGDIWMDGGSVSIRIVDKNGHNHDFIFIYDSSKPEAPYTRAIHGTWDSNEIQGIAMKNTERARILAIRLLSENANPTDPSVRRAVEHLKDGRRSLAKRLLNSAESCFKP